MVEKIKIEYKEDIIKKSENHQYLMQIILIDIIKINFNKSEESKDEN